jgi:hypothetical protein
MSAHRGKADLALRPARMSGNDLYASGAMASQSSICHGAKAQLIGDNLLRERPCRPPLNPDVADNPDARRRGKITGPGYSQTLRAHVKDTASYRSFGHAAERLPNKRIVPTSF